MNVLALLPLSCLAALAMAQSDERDASDARCREIVAQHAAGKLDVAAALAALSNADEAVARTAAAIVRHEWLELPPALFDGLATRPGALRILLRELAIAPRPAAAAWAAGLARDEQRGLDDRCLAVAARGAPFGVADGELLLRALAADEAGDGYRTAAAVLPAKIADALLGRVHAALASGKVDLDHAGPLLDRVSDTGARAMLGLVVSLPPPMAAALCLRVNERAPALVAERTAAALDRKVPLDAVWLPFAAPLLTSPARVARVAGLMRDEKADPSVREDAYRALVAAKAIDAPLLQYVADDGDERLRLLLDAAIDEVPAATLVDWLHGDARRSLLVVRALAQRSRLEPELEAELVQLAAPGGTERLVPGYAAIAIAQRGSAATLRTMLQQQRGTEAWEALVAAMSRRTEPFVAELLVAELDAARATLGPSELDALALALTALGDRRELERLVTGAAKAKPAFVRRCSHHADPLPAAYAKRLIADAVAVADGGLATEMVSWAATAAADADVQKALLALWQQPPDVPFAAELQDVAMRALAEGRARKELADELRAALAKGPLPALLEPLDFELLASMPSAPAAEDLALCCDLVLLAPRTDPEREARQLGRWSDGIAGFPLVAAVAERLRGADPAAVAKAFGAAAREAAADPRHTAISPQRLLVLWHDLIVAPAVQRAAATATAELVLGLCKPGDVAMGPAAWFAMLAAVDRGDFAAARRHAVTARDELLRVPARRRYARLFLGERDPGSGIDPWAALAAWPHVIDVLAARAAGDGTAEASAAARVREFAGHDTGVIAMLRTPSAEIVK